MEFQITQRQLEELRRCELRKEWSNVLGFAFLGIGCGTLPLLWFLSPPPAWVLVLGQGALFVAIFCFWRVVKLKKARAAIIDAVRLTGS